MLPIILVAVGAYLIGDSVLQDTNKYAKGGEIADIDKAKKSLIAKAKSKGIYENFGQKERRLLEDKYGYTPAVRDFDNWAANFDLSQMEDGGYMAKGGETKMPEWAVTITSEDGDSYDWDGFAKSEDDALYKAEQEAGFDSVESSVIMITDENGEKIEYAKGGALKNWEDEMKGRKDIEFLRIERKEKLPNGNLMIYYKYNTLNELETTKVGTDVIKMAKGGKLVGKQKNLDVNKNGKLDAEDFKILRGEKMADGGFVKYTFNSHKNHNPNADILEGHLDKDSFMTYGVYVKDTNKNKKGDEFMEYYSGENYKVGSTKKSSSRRYDADKIPSKYKIKWLALKSFYNKEYQ